MGACQKVIAVPSTLAPINEVLRLPPADQQFNIFP
jgi:hypothetical protein